MDKSEEYSIWKKLHSAEGEQAFHLAVFGDFIAEREKYTENSGLDAIRYYLIQKFHWLPSQVNGLSYNDIHFILSEEMSGWTLPKDAMKVYKEGKNE
jgi:hypothetical protein